MDRKELVQCCVASCQRYYTTMAFAFRRYFGIADALPNRRRECMYAAVDDTADLMECMAQSHGVEM